MQISNSSLVFLAINTGAALTNAYCSPVSYSLSFAVGIITGLGVGLMHRLVFLTVDLNEKAVQQVKGKTKSLQEMLSPIKDQIQEPFVNEKVANISGYVGPIFRIFLFFSGYGKVYDTATSYLGHFKEQRLKIIEKLNPIPGTFLTFISASALVANLGYLKNPIISSITRLAGFPMGYAAGKFLMRNFDWKYLKSESYEKTLISTTY